MIHSDGRVDAHTIKDVAKFLVFRKDILDDPRQTIYDHSKDEYRRLYQIYITAMYVALMKQRLVEEQNINDTVGEILEEPMNIDHIHNSLDDDEGGIVDGVKTYMGEWWNWINAVPEDIHDK